MKLEKGQKDSSVFITDTFAGPRGSDVVDGGQDVPDCLLLSGGDAQCFHGNHQLVEGD